MDSDDEDMKAERELFRKAEEAKKKAAAEAPPADDGEEELDEEAAAALAEEEARLLAELEEAERREAEEAKKKAEEESKRKEEEERKQKEEAERKAAIEEEKRRLIEEEKERLRKEEEARFKAEEEKRLAIEAEKKRLREEEMRKEKEEEAARKAEQDRIEAERRALENETPEQREKRLAKERKEQEEAEKQAELEYYRKQEEYEQKQAEMKKKREAVKNKAKAEEDKKKKLRDEKKKKLEERKKKLVTKQAKEREMAIKKKQEEEEAAKPPPPPPEGMVMTKDESDEKFKIKLKLPGGTHYYRFWVDGEIKILEDKPFENLYDGDYNRIKVPDIGCAVDVLIEWDEEGRSVAVLGLDEFDPDEEKAAEAKKKREEREAKEAAEREAAMAAAYGGGDDYSSTSSAAQVDTNQSSSSSSSSSAAAAAAPAAPTYEPGIELDKNSAGVWSVSLYLPAGRHLYRVQVDGEMKLDDKVDKKVVDEIEYNELVVEEMDGLDTVPVDLEYSGEGEKVIVMGLDKWHPDYMKAQAARKKEADENALAAAIKWADLSECLRGIPMTNVSGTVWKVTIKLPPGKHFYKYSIDGDEYGCIDPNKPMENTPDGLYNPVEVDGPAGSLVPTEFVWDEGGLNSISVCGLDLYHPDPWKSGEIRKRKEEAERAARAEAGEDEPAATAAADTSDLSPEEAAAVWAKKPPTLRGIPMSKKSATIHSVTIKLPPGQHAYKYSIDGDEYGCIDPNKSMLNTPEGLYNGIEVEGEEGTLVDTTFVWEEAGITSINLVGLDIYHPDPIKAAAAVKRRAELAAEAEAAESGGGSSAAAAAAADDEATDSYDNYNYDEYAY